ncbi:GNAT family N-acetyltransferase, partial [Nonomuraea insulae]
LHHLDLTQPLPTPTTPPTYTLRHLTGPDDAPARATIHRTAFTQPGHPPSRVTTDSYRTVMNTDPYNPHLDWIACTPDGTPAAISLIWYDPHHHDALIEPTGTHPAHRRRGLATATTLAALHTARDLGARTARVTTRDNDPAPRALYQTLGFRPHTRTTTYHRPT